VLVIADNADGTGATATLSNCDAGITYTVYTMRNGSNTPTNSGSRVGNGDVTLSLANGQYTAFVIGGSDGSTNSVGQAAHFWVTAGDSWRVRTRARAASEAVRVISGNGTSRQKGIQVTIETPGSDDVTVWALEISRNQRTMLRSGQPTDETTASYHIPLQTGFPPDTIKVGMRLTDDRDNTYGIDDIDGLDDLDAIFVVNCSKLNDGSNGEW